MFFSISNQQENNFTRNYNVKSVWVNVDSGWTVAHLGDYLVIYKGYSDNFLLSNTLNEIFKSDLPFDLGNYCALFVDKNSGHVQIKTDRYRSFPIYVDANKSVTNLKIKDYTVWSDSIITVNPDITIEEKKFNLIGDIDVSVLDYDYIVEEINKILHKKTQLFLANNFYPIKAHLSGGVDSLLVYAYLRAHTTDFELIKSLHIDYDQFWLLNNTDLQKYWGYRQIHHWNNKCVLTSGAPGDEFMLRSPTTVDLYLKARNIKITDLLGQDSWKNCLHYSYFTKPSHLEVFNSQTIDHQKTLEDHNYQLCDKNLNDWQHWHLGNTLTWTPLRDLDIFKLMIRLPIDSAIEQILDSKLSKELIAKINPEFVHMISDQKNSEYPMKNLVNHLMQN
jgi:hypothetical protein